MSIESRTYSTKIIRPKPELQHDSDNLLLVTTPWGPRETAKRVQQLFTDYFLSSNEDLETTSPFPKLTCLSPIANNLRTATMLANEVVYREANRDEFVTGVELFAASHIGNDFVWLQVGQPHILLFRQGKWIHPIAVALDLSFEFNSDRTTPIHPLPKYLLGTDPTVNATIGNFKPQSGDELILISRTIIPYCLFELKSTVSLDTMVQLIAEENQALPFWIGKMQF